MFCPVCRDEYRPGFTRCASCDVALVDSLDGAPKAAPEVVIVARPPELGMLTFCGFMTLDEARAARDELRSKRLRAEILIAEAPAANLEEPAVEEFWLRVSPHDVRAVRAILGDEPVAASTHDDDTFQCSACGTAVHASDAKCPGCGLGFDE